MKLLATITPTELTLKHTEDETHILNLVDDGGSEVSVLLTDDMFQALWAACEAPEPQQ